MPDSSAFSLAEIFAKATPKERAKFLKECPELIREADTINKLFDIKESLIAKVTECADFSMLQKCLNFFNGFGLPLEDNTQPVRRTVYLENDKVYSKRQGSEPIEITGIEFSTTAKRFVLVPSTKQGYGRGPATTIDSVSPKVKEQLKAKFPDKYSEYETWLDSPSDKKSEYADIQTKYKPTAKGDSSKSPDTHPAAMNASIDLELRHTVSTEGIE